MVALGAIPQSGLSALLKRGPSEPSFAASGALHELLAAGGFRPVRTLAEREGLIFIEAAKPRDGRQERPEGPSRLEDSPAVAKKQSIRFCRSALSFRGKRPRNIGKAFASAVTRPVSILIRPLACPASRPAEHADCYSPREIAQAAGVSEQQVLAAVGSPTRYISHEDAVRIGRALQRSPRITPAPVFSPSLSAGGGHRATRPAARPFEHAARRRLFRGRFPDDGRADTGGGNGGEHAIRFHAPRLRRVAGSRRGRWRRRLAAERRRRRRPSVKAITRSAVRFP